MLVSFRLSLITLFFLVLSGLHVQAQTNVRVLGYAFPPFINEDLKSGLSIDLVNLLNSSQSQYHFDLKFTAPKRRYQDLKSSKFDMMLFEMRQWGWEDQKIEVQTTRPILKGGEVYITKNLPERDFKFFKSLKDKRIAGYFGYHYAFADFISDRDILQKKFNIMLYHSHERIVEMVRLNKADVGIVTLSYLRRFLKKYPEIKGEILVSDVYDQIYQLPALLSKDAPISIQQMETLLDQLKQNGELQKLFQAHGLEAQLVW